MKRVLLMCVALLVGCSNCKSSSQTEPVPIPPPTVVIPDAGSPQPTATASVPQPVPEAIDWKTPEELVDIGRENPEVCAMVYFPDILNGTREIEKTFTDPDVVKFINSTFVSVKFPLTIENIDLAKDEFQIDGFPTTMFVPVDGTVVLHVKGHPTPEALLGGLKEVTKESAPFAGCEGYRAKVTD